MTNRQKDGPAPAVCMPGLLLLGPERNLIACNAEAIRILSFPGNSARRHLNALITEKIPPALFQTLSEGKVFEEFVSGRRRYVCSGHRLDLLGGSKGTTAILMERASSPKITLYGICQKYNLTAREREAMGHLLQGLTSKEIAQEMGISPNTVKAFLRSVMTKMGVSTRAGLIGRVAGTTPGDIHEHHDFGNARS